VRETDHQLNEESKETCDIWSFEWVAGLFAEVALRETWREAWKESFEDFFFRERDEIAGENGRGHYFCLSCHSLTLELYYIYPSGRVST